MTSVMRPADVLTSTWTSPNCVGTTGPLKEPPAVDVPGPVAGATLRPGLTFDVAELVPGSLEPRTGGAVAAAPAFDVVAPGVLKLRRSARPPAVPSRVATVRVRTFLPARQYANRSK